MAANLQVNIKCLNIFKGEHVVPVVYANLFKNKLKFKKYIYKKNRHQEISLS